MRLAWNLVLPAGASETLSQRHDAPIVEVMWHPWLMTQKTVDQLDLSPMNLMSPT
jgi:hypothetical protein